MTFAIGSVQGAVVASVLFLVVISAVEAVVWIKNRQRPFVGSAMTVLTIVLYGAIWWWLWSGFYKVTVSDQAVALTKYLPTRVTTLDMAQITAVRWVPGYKGTWVLVIESAAGRFESARASLAEDERHAITAALERKQVARDAGNDGVGR